MIQWHELYGWGFSVFPLKARDKRPLGPWERYQKERAAGSELALWAQAPHLNGGIATGEISGIFVVDLDSDEAAAAFYKRGVPRTPTVKTAKGLHVYFRHPGFPVKNSAGRLGSGIDVRGDGGYVCAPGSIHPTGTVYKWETPPEDAPLAEAPAWLVAELKHEAPALPILAAPVPTQGHSAYVDAALDREIQKLRQAGEGRRNDTLNVAAMVFGQFVGSRHITESYAQTRLLAEALYVGLGEREARSTIASGLKKGLSEPRAVPERASPAPSARPAPYIVAGKGFTAAALQDKTFAPISWVVPGIIVEGLTLLAGKPKRSKSWFALNCALAVASGGPALGIAACAAGDVLALMLEDNPRRLQDRLRQIEPSARWPERLTFHTEWPRLDEGALEALETWVQAAANPRLIVVDVLAAVRAPGNAKKSPYADDYGCLEGLQKFASKHRLAVVVVHHCRKAAADEDAFDEISCTTGLTGAADSALVLKRGEGKTDFLYGRGRDLPEFEKAITFDKTRGLWTVQGEADDFRGGAMKTQICDTLAEANEPMSVAAIVRATGADYEAVKQRLYRMAGSGEIRKVERGRYTSAA